MVNDITKANLGSYTCVATSEAGTKQISAHVWTPGTLSWADKKSGLKPRSKFQLNLVNWGQLVQLDSDQTRPFSILTNWFGLGLTVFN